MNIAVLIKQVPEIDLVKVDEGANEVVLPSGPGVVNPFDEYAVEEALKLKEAQGGKVSVISFGYKFWHGESRISPASLPSIGSRRGDFDNRSNV
jgi:electron transfer flavoprotein alpha/beta subunit